MIAFEQKDKQTGSVAPPDLPDVAEYRRTLERARDKQLELTAENLNRLAQTYDRAAQNIVAKVRALPADRVGKDWIAAQLNLYRQIVEEMDALKRDFAGVLDLSLLSTAQQVADRERDIEQLVEATPDPRLPVSQSKPFTLTTGTEYTVEFGKLAKDAVERTVTRYYSDGLKLSDRLYRLDTAMRQSIENVIVEGIATGDSARRMAKRLEEKLTAAGADNPRHRAMVISRTEISQAYREASREAVMQGGKMKPYVSALGWRLSASHPEPDICDIYAGHDSGLGRGNYLSSDYPSAGHPNCLCFSVSVLVAYPDEQFETLAPDVESVPESQVRYYAQRLNDPVAAARLAKR